MVKNLLIYYDDARRLRQNMPFNGRRSAYDDGGATLPET